MAGADSALRARAAAVDLLALDVDGTLTDGRIYIGPQGEAMKAFSVRDGFGLTLLREAGIRIAIITARRSEIVERRAAELGIEMVLQGVRDKRTALESLCAQTGIALERTAFAGDDWTDLPAMLACGLAASVADAAQAVRERAHWVSTLPAGAGAIRELAEFILASRGQLQIALERRLAASDATAGSDRSSDSARGAVDGPAAARPSTSKTDRNVGSPDSRSAEHDRQ